MESTVGPCSVASVTWSCVGASYWHCDHSLSIAPAMVMALDRVGNCCYGFHCHYGHYCWSHQSQEHPLGHRHSVPAWSVSGHSRRTMLLLLLLLLFPLVLLLLLLDSYWQNYHQILDPECHQCRRCQRRRCGSRPWPEMTMIQTRRMGLSGHRACHPESSWHCCPLTWHCQHVYCRNWWSCAPLLMQKTMM